MKIKIQNDFRVGMNIWVADDGVGAEQNVSSSRGKRIPTANPPMIILASPTNAALAITLLSSIIFLHKFIQ